MTDKPTASEVLTVEKVRQLYAAEHYWPRAHGAVGVLLAEIDRLQAKRNRIRSEWDPGPAPTCAACGNAARLEAADVGNGIAFGWACSCGLLTDELAGTMTWPFIDDVASAEDFRLAGFEVL